MVALVPVLLLAQVFEPALGDERVGPRARTYRPEWRVELAVGAENPVSDAALWLAGVGEPAATLRVHYSLDRFVPGLATHVGANLWDRGQLGDGAADLTLLVTEAELGASWQWPRDGFWQLLFPYVRASVLLGYWRVRAGGLGDDIWFKPGVRAALGLRLHLGQLVERGPVSARLYLFGEGGFAARLSGRPRLGLLDDDDGALLAGVPTRLGPLNLSGWSWSAGLGFAF